MKPSFKIGTAVVFEPGWAVNKTHFIEYTDGKHPLGYGEVVYFIADIPNVPGHCIVVTNSGRVVPMIHSVELRKADEDEV